MQEPAALTAKGTHQHQIFSHAFFSYKLLVVADSSPVSDLLMTAESTRKYFWRYKPHHAWQQVKQHNSCSRGPLNYVRQQSIWGWVGIISVTVDKGHKFTLIKGKHLRSGKLSWNLDEKGLFDFSRDQVDLGCKIYTHQWSFSFWDGGSIYGSSLMMNSLIAEYINYITVRNHQLRKQL